jgi:alpha-galactosidase
VLIFIVRKSKLRRAASCLVASVFWALLTGCGLNGQVPSLADTPPMGWNSWDAYGTTINEAEVKANADYMAKVLRPYGWTYIVVDIQWSEPNPKSHGYREGATLSMDQFGRLIPAPNRFPSSADGAGFKPLADYVHSRGLKFGIHIMRGIPRQAVKRNTPVLGSDVHAGDVADQTSVCKWNTDMFGLNMSRPGAQAYVDSIVKMYADWGVDYIKADDEARPLHKEEIEALHRAIGKTKRAIVLSLSPGPTQLADGEFLAHNAQLWRVSNDVWDKWSDVYQNFEFLANWSSYAKPGQWPDADMLPLGHIGMRAERGNDRESNLTHDEQQTLLSLWFIAKSPLMFGGDLPTVNDWTRSLLTNREALDVNQKGDRPRQLFRRGNQIAWISGGPEGTTYLALFNTSSEAPESIALSPSAIGLSSGSFTIRDLWKHADLGSFTAERQFTIPAHGSLLLSLSRH